MIIHSLLEKVQDRAKELEFQFNLIGDSEYIGFLRWVEYDSLNEIERHIPQEQQGPCPNCGVITFDGDWCYSCMNKLLDEAIEIVQKVVTEQEGQNDVQKGVKAE